MTNQKVSPDVELLRRRENPLPVPGELNVLVTSALPYVNNVPHLGNIIGSVLSADVFSRYNKARNRNTLYVSGTDEYGTATETKALEEGTTPRELCDKYHVLHRQVYDWFEIGFDYFGRTTTETQTTIAQHIFTKLDDNGFLQEEVGLQPYCSKHESFLADRFIEGVCPKCQFEDARGDQCDQCGSLLNALELVNPRCKIDGASPVAKETKHLHLRLDKLQPELEPWFSRSADAGKWSRNGLRITQVALNDKLIPRPITRDLRWGTPVPLAGYEQKVLYVWFDACIGYISITAENTKEWQAWWRNPDQVRLYQFMGKDNVPFHSIIFPSSLIGTREKWTMAHHISTSEYLNYEGGKFSKSRSIGVFGDDAQRTGVAASVWRYYLLATRPETSDAKFEWNSFMLKNNSELLANLGNLVNRLVKFTNKHFNGFVPDYNAQTESDTFPDFHHDVNRLLTSYLDHMEAVRLRAGLETAMSISTRGNQFLSESKLGSALVSEDPKRAAVVVGRGLNLLYLLSAVFSPYMPSVAREIAAQLNAPERAIPASWTARDLLPGHKIGEANHIFHRISVEQVDNWRRQFGGGQLQGSPSHPKTSKSSSITSATIPGVNPRAVGGQRDFLPSLVDFRVGKIIRALKHPGADSLYVSTVACGDSPGTIHTAWDAESETTVRTVCSALNGKIALGELQGRAVVVVANLKPVNMRGVISSAMVLAAMSTNSTGSSLVELVTPPSNAKIGDRLLFEGWTTCSPATVLKAKTWESLQTAIETSDTCEVVLQAARIPPNFVSGNFNGVSGSGCSRLVDRNGASCRVTTLRNSTVK